MHNSDCMTGPCQCKHEALYGSLVVELDINYIQSSKT